MFAKIIIVGWTVWVLYGFVSGLADARATGASEGVFTVVMVLSVFIHLATWCLVALPTYMISRLFQKRRDVIVMTPPEPQMPQMPYVDRPVLEGSRNVMRRPGFAASQLNHR